MNAFNPVQVRFLDSEERNISTNLPQVPLVIQAKSFKETSVLNNYLASNSDYIKNMISQHGAVLLRNFNIRSEKDFENAVTSIRGVHAMSSYFMSEPGRSVVDGTKFVFYANKTFRTGGTLRFGGFHTECYYCPDVPRFICFCCLDAPMLGGETGLVDMANVYQGFNEELKVKLQSKAFAAGSDYVSEIASRYGVTSEKVKEICINYGLSLLNPPASGDEEVLYYKSSVFEHPIAKTKVFIANLKALQIEADLVKYFGKDYLGLRWTMHRLAWKSPLIMQLNDALSLSFFSLLKEVRAAISEFVRRLPRKSNQEENIPLDRIEGIFNNQSKADVARLIRHNFSSFKWQRGDILLVDNFRMAHAGMPGLGSRVLRVMLCNPVKMQMARSTSGHQTLNFDSEHESLADVMWRYSQNEI